MKLIILIVGLVLGFGIGVYWGVHNPTQAANLSQQEEQWYLKGKMEATEAIKARLDQALSKSSTPSTPSSGFVGGNAVAGGGSGANAADALRQLRDEQDQQLKSMQGQLANLPKK